MRSADIDELTQADLDQTAGDRLPRKRRRVERHAWRCAVLRKRDDRYYLRLFRHEHRQRLAGRRILIDDVGAMMTAGMARVDRAARRIFLLSATRRGSEGAGAAVDGGKPLHDLPALDQFPRLAARHI